MSRASMLLLFQTEKTSNNNISKLWPLKKENKQTTSSKSNEKLQVVFLYMNENYLIENLLLRLVERSQLCQ